MNEFKEFLTSSEMIIVGIIAAVGCFLGLIVYIFDKTYYKRKQRHNTKELNNLVEDVSKEMEKEEIKPVAVSTINNDLVNQPKVTTIEEALSVAESIEDKSTVSVVEEVAPAVENPKEEAVEVVEQMSNDIHEENIDIIDDNFVEEDIEEQNDVYEKAEEKPLVIPIEEYEASKSIEDIYSEVKEKVESLENAPVEEKLEYTDIEPNKEEAIAELKKVTENLIKKEENKLDPENIELTKFEEEQEENAIISMDELLRKSNELYEKNEVTQYEDEGNEPISLQDLELRMNNIKSEMMTIEEEERKEEALTIETNTNDTQPIYNLKQPDTTMKSPKMVLDDFNTIGKSDKIYRDDIVFKSSPIISPIFGIEENVPSNDMMLENTANYDKFDAEIKKTNEFIVTLKELQEKLD